MKRITKINDNEYISKEVEHTTSLTGTIIELIIYLSLLAALTKFVNIWLQEVKIIKGEKVQCLFITELGNNCYEGLFVTETGVKFLSDFSNVLFNIKR